MSPSKVSLNLKSPPVVEVVLSVQFEPIPGLNGALIGLLWEKEFRKEYPKISEHPPIDHVVETFSLGKGTKQSVRLEINAPPVTPRYWFRDAGEASLVQVQRDRLVHNWRRKEGDEPYPRYSNLQPGFREDCTKLASFLRQQSLGEFKPNQCELTYVDEITSPDFDVHKEPYRVLEALADSRGIPHAEAQEDFQLVLSFLIEKGGDWIGRMHVKCTCVFRSQDQVPALLLNTTARGKPLGEGVEGVFAFLDTAHETVLEFFEKFITEEMFKTWRQA